MNRPTAMTAANAMASWTRTKTVAPSMYMTAVWVVRLLEGSRPRTAAAGGRPQAGLDDLRHTAGTLATAAGGSLREVMDWLGHSTTVAAVRYQNVMADRDAAIARELNRLIEDS